MGAHSTLQPTHRIKRSAPRAGALLAAGALAWALLPGTAEAVPATAPTVSDYASLSADVAAGRNVMLGADITHSGSALLVSTTKAVAIDLAGHDLTLTGAAGDPAVDLPAGARLTIKDLVGGGNATANGGSGQAGIRVNPGATLTLHDGPITANGGTGGAGIGGSQSEAGGTLIVHHGIVTATGGAGGAGIGGGTGGAGGALNVTGGVTGGQVTAIGGAGGAGIGGGAGADGGPLTITGGFTVATGGSGAAGVGGGAGGHAGSGAAGAVFIGASGVLTAKNGGSGAPAIALGSLTNAGLLRILDNANLPVPAGVTVENSGLIRLSGTLTGTGTVHNTGTILPTPIGNKSRVADAGQGPAGSALLVTTHNYTVKFVLDGLPGTVPDSLDIYAASISTARQTLPTVPSRTGFTFTGWYTAKTGGTRVTDATVLATVTAPGPSLLTLHPHYKKVVAPSTTASSAGAGSTSAGATSTSPTSTAPLANTGADSGSVLNLALLLLGGGMALLFAGRRRGARHARRH